MSQESLYWVRINAPFGQTAATFARIPVAGDLVWIDSMSGTARPFVALVVTKVALYQNPRCAKNLEKMTAGEGYAAEITVEEKAYEDNGGR